MGSEITHKVINDPANCVDESLQGFVIANPHVTLFKGHRILVRKNVEQLRAAGKVLIVAGGGSGHEPMFAGHLGQGGLTAAVAGSVFASPPADAVLAALKVVANPTGTLLFIINYTGDRLNFGLAVERAARLIPENGPIRVVVVGEDCALTSSDRTAGRRGLAGSSLILKIAGAMAEHGKSLDEICTFCEDVIKHTGTIGVSLSSCSLPGGGPLFQLKKGEMELGLGVHGEKGVAVMAVGSARSVVDRMLNHMTKPDSATRLELKDGDRVVVFVNNLGGTTQIEMNIICFEVHRWMTSHNIQISRLYSGAHMTSLEMHGFSISVMVLGKNSTVLEYLDAPLVGSSLFQPTTLGSAETHGMPKLINVDIESSENRADVAESTSDEATSLFVRCVTAACAALVSSDKVLNDLDSEAGDGDCGATMKRGAEAVIDMLTRSSNGSVSNLIEQISRTWEHNTGGTSGAIYSIMLSAGSRHLTGTCDRAAWVCALDEGLNAVMKYGRAGPGDRTVVDVFHAILSTAKSIKPNISNAEAFDQISKSAYEAVESTRSMKASAGRASYVGSKALTQPDPGAMAAAIWIGAAAKAFKK